MIQSSISVSGSASCLSAAGAYGFGWPAMLPTWEPKGQYKTADGTQEKAKPKADPTTMAVRINGTKDRHLG